MEVIIGLGGGLATVLILLGLVALVQRRRPVEQTSGTGGALSSRATDATGRSAPQLVTWEDVQPQFPQGWGPLATLPLEYHGGRLRRVDSPFAQALVRGVIDAAPAVFTAANSSQLFKFVGPPEALDGLASGTVNWLRDRAGGQLMTLTDASGTFRHQARVEAVGTGPQSAAVAACVFQVLSVATAQYYLHQITAQLTTIAEGVEEVLGKLLDQRFGKLAAASATIGELHAGAVKSLASGALPQRLEASNEFWARMASSEQALREVVGECESDYARRRAQWHAKVGRQQSNKTWVRERFGKRDEIAFWEDIRGWTTTVGTIYLSAIREMVRWYELTITHDSMTGSEQLRTRYESMTSFLDSRVAFLSQWWGDGDFYLAHEGEARSDIAKDIGAAFLGGLSLGYSTHIAAKTDEAHNDKRLQLATSYDEFRGHFQPLLAMDAARGAKHSEFILQALPSERGTSYAMYAPVD